MPAEIKVFTQQNLQGNKIVNVGAPVADTDVATKASAQAQADAAKNAAEATAASLASAAQTAAIAAAATDATTKANAAVTTANAYTDAQVLAANATVLASANEYTDAAITSLINGAPEALDTLNELASALGDNEDAVAALVSSIATVSGDLATETTNRTTADSALQGSIDGTNYSTVSTSYANASSYTVTNAATNTYIFEVTGSPYRYYRLSYTGAGTMSCSHRGYLMPNKK
jgi:hypothetical protein